MTLSRPSTAKSPSPARGSGIALAAGKAFVEAGAAVVLAEVNEDAMAHL
jgi:hypothetical protein